MLLSHTFILFIIFIILLLNNIRHGLFLLFLNLYLRHYFGRFNFDFNLFIYLMGRWSRLMAELYSHMLTVMYLLFQLQPKHNDDGEYDNRDEIH